MNPPHLSRLLLLVTALPLVAHAHPGHDGHELVWEIAGTHVHLDWVLGTLMVAAAVVGLYRYARRRS